MNGLITVIWGTIVFLVLPASPMEAKFLTENERVLAVHRIRANNTGILNRVFKWRQVITKHSRRADRDRYKKRLTRSKILKGYCCS